jgi:osmotically inducible protein OsmC
MIRRAKAVWRGTGRAGNGNLSTDSGVLAETPYSYKTRFENEKGTNPEELIAAAHAGCFTMALAFQLQGAGYTPHRIDHRGGGQPGAGRSGFSHHPLGAHAARQRA